MERPCTQAPCPEPPIHLVQAKRQDAEVRNRARDRAKLGYGGRQGIGNGEHGTLDSARSPYVP